MQDVFPPAAFTQPEPSRRRYSRSVALLLSFFSADLYRDVARRWRGIGLTYLLLLLAVSWIPMTAKLQIGFSKFAKDEAPVTLQGFPAITITKGVVSIDRPSPYLWKDPQTGEVLLYVDTTNKFDLPEGASAKARLGSSSLELKQDQYNSRKTDLSQIQSFSVDKTRLQGWLHTATPWIGISFFILCLFGSLIWHLIQILIYGLIGLAFCAMFGARLDYPALLRLAAVAITPAILLDTVLDLAGVSIPVSGLLFLAIEIGYLAFAVKANATEVQPSVQGFPMSFPPPPPLA
jgi:hypothetical protein